MLKQCCDLLEQKKLTIAFIESASAGYFSNQFAVHKNSGADILLGGLVSYDPSIKRSILHVPAELINHYTAESAEVTEAMAIAGKKLFAAADIVLSCTGLLKKGGSACKKKPVGTFFIVILFQNKLHHYHYQMTGRPEEKLRKLCQLICIELIRLIQTKPD